MRVAGFDFPDDLHYSVEHQVWARLEGAGLATVGITSLGVKQAGEIYMCRARLPGTLVEQGRSIAVVEVAKAILSVKSPLSGTVVATNPRLAEEPERVHRDPYGDGWIARLRLHAFEAESAALVHGRAAGDAMARHAWLMRLDEEAS